MWLCRFKLFGLVGLSTSMVLRIKTGFLTGISVFEILLEADFAATPAPLPLQGGEIIYSRVANTPTYDYEAIRRAERVPSNER